MDYGKQYYCRHSSDRPTDITLGLRMYLDRNFVLFRSQQQCFYQNNECQVNNTLTTRRLFTAVLRLTFRYSRT
jgi:hypothetical protein